VVSAKEGINNEDYYVAKFLKKYRGKNIILIANKTENNSIDNLNIYYSLGFGKPIYASAEHGIGIGDLLDDIIKYDTHNQVLDIINHKPIAFCLIGRTNVGKSTLVNTILQQERMMVSPIPHTTRDSVDTTFTYQQQIYTIIDTAGIRRKGKITDNIEKYAVLRSQQAIKRSNIIILLLDGSQPFNEQDEIIGGLAYKANIPTVICVNK
jgi:GTP-binding protein